MPDRRSVALSRPGRDRGDLQSTQHEPKRHCHSPYETVEEKLEFFPRQINDRYEKQIFVRNLLNRPNDQLVEIRSKNVDVNNVTLHSHLYRILTPSGSNFLDFGLVVINSPTVRTVQFENLPRRNWCSRSTRRSPKTSSCLLRRRMPRLASGAVKQVASPQERITSPQPEWGPEGEVHGVVAGIEAREPAKPTKPKPKAKRKEQ